MKFFHRISAALGVLLLACVLISCHHDQSKSFHDLSDAFLQWYYKGNPTTATSLGIHGFDGDFRHFDKDYQRDHLADLKRFDLELSQIDRAKLSENDEIDYLIMSKNIQRLIYEVSSYLEESWNPLLYQQEIYHSFLGVITDQSISMEMRTKAAIGKLGDLGRYLTDVEFVLEKSNDFLVTTALDLLGKNEQLISELPLQLSGDNFTLDKIDILISDAVKQLQKHRVFLEKMQTESGNLPSAESYKSELSRLLQEGTSAENLHSRCERGFTAVQNEMFNLAYPYYLQENDEPVWVGRQDTLQVIAWSLHQLDSRRSTDPDVLLSKTSSFIKKIKSNLTVNHFVDVGNTSVLVRWEDHAILHPNPIWLSSSGYTSIKHEVFVALTQRTGQTPLIDLLDDDFNDYKLDVLTMMAAYPGALVKFEYDLKSSSPLRLVFPDLPNLNGWPIYSTGAFLEAGFEKDNYLNYLAFLAQKLKIDLMAMASIEFYTNQKSKEELIKFFETQGFLSGRESSTLLQVISYSPYYAPTAFAGFMKFQKLMSKIEQESAANFSIGDFHHTILSAGSIPLEYFDLLKLY